VVWEAPGYSGNMRSKSEFIVILKIPEIGCLTFYNRKTFINITNLQ
jgi:hypothetical protein